MSESIAPVSSQGETSYFDWLFDFVTAGTGCPSQPEYTSENLLRAALMSADNDKDHPNNYQYAARQSRRAASDLECQLFAAHVLHAVASTRTWDFAAARSSSSSAKKILELFGTGCRQSGVRDKIATGEKILQKLEVLICETVSLSLRDPTYRRFEALREFVTNGETTGSSQQ